MTWSGYAFDICLISSWFSRLELIAHCQARRPRVASWEGGQGVACGGRRAAVAGEERLSGCGGHPSGAEWKVVRLLVYFFRLVRDDCCGGVGRSGGFESVGTVASGAQVGGGIIITRLLRGSLQLSLGVQPPYNQVNHLPQHCIKPASVSPALPCPARPPATTIIPHPHSPQLIKSNSHPPTITTKPINASVDFTSLFSCFFNLSAFGIGLAEPARWVTFLLCS